MIRNNFLTQITEKYQILKLQNNNKKQKIWMVNVRCDCGTEKTIKFRDLETGRIKSCGCYNKKAASERMSAYNNIATYDSPTDHPLYQTFISMKSRATNQNMKNYLGNGFVEEWKNYDNFYKWAIQFWSPKMCIRPLNKNKPFGPNNAYFIAKSKIVSENVIKGQNNYKKTCLKKYGVDHFFKSEQGKEILSKTRQGKGIIHGKTGSKLWGVWQRMIMKCENPHYHRYQVGLTLFSEWKDFNIFEKWCLENGYNKDLKFERKNNNQGFSPENCIFLSSVEKSKKYQSKVRRTTLERYGVEYATKNIEIRQKQINTMLKKYGRAYPKSGSGHQNEIKSFLESLGYEFKTNIDILQGKEIDLYNAELKFGIEYCGLYWHTELSLEPRLRSYHYDKWRMCKEQDINLITIFSDEWLKRKDQVKSFLRSRLNIYNQKIYARNCNIKEVEKNKAKDFIEKYHIQGSKNSLKYFGIYYENELNGIMSFAKHHRNFNELVLDRLCFKSDIKIIGGASKLLSSGIEWAKNDFKFIKTWSDNRWSNGTVYSKIGFILNKNLPPDYSYVNMKKANTRNSKQQMRKKNINCPIDRKEVDYCAELGFARIWDCGKKRWLLEL